MKKILAVALIVVAGVFMLSVPSVMAQGETGDCYGNFDCDQDVDAIDVGNFLLSFGRSPYFNPCPLCQDSLCPCSSTVPKTGQTTSYATGDDGDLEKGLIWPNPRFTDNGDGTVTDNLTNLVWLKNANCFGLRTWNNALSDCNGLSSGYCGLTDGSSAGDWRLPNVNELLHLVDRGQNNPALPTAHPFINVQNDYCWTSTSNDFYPYDAWTVSFFAGEVWGHNKFGTLWFVWPVRGGR